MSESRIGRERIRRFADQFDGESLTEAGAIRVEQNAPIAGLLCFMGKRPPKTNVSLR